MKPTTFFVIVNLLAMVAMLSRSRAVARLAIAAVFGVAAIGALGIGG
jgi:hypothetical protein